MSEFVRVAITMRYSKKLIIGLLITLITVITGTLYYRGQFGPHLSLSKTSFRELPHWARDEHTKALLAFKRSCAVIAKKEANLAFNSLPQAGKVKDWQNICSYANNINATDNKAAREFFESMFQPYAVKNNLRSYGLFTGYYLPLLHASFTPSERYAYPIYGLPRDLLRIHLGAFYPELSGKTIIGQLKNKRVTPYPNRRAISQGAIRETAPVLLWGDDEIDIFFAQIQGSALIQLPNGKQQLIGYAQSNGRAYTPLGKVMVEKGILAKKAVSMQSIKAWLVAHPKDMSAILNENASYVFFQHLKTNDPIGTEQVPLTAERSLAVDTRYIPLGTPIWLDTTVTQNQAEKSVAYQHLMVAQDTGGSIKGVIRGDVYWGAGEKAAYMAGHMQSKGRYWILLPRHLQH
jgi:membrane-bound lytic murein transglycosylase A